MDLALSVGMSRPHRLPVAACSGGYRHFLTICTRDRRQHFADSSVIALTIDQFLHTARLEAFEILAYCFMPDHLHALVEDALADVIRYVINNPVRAGLVESPAAYRYWGSQTYAREEILEFVQESNTRRV